MEVSWDGWLLLVEAIVHVINDQNLRQRIFLNDSRLVELSKPVRQCWMDQQCLCYSNCSRSESEASNDLLLTAWKKACDSDSALYNVYSEAVFEYQNTVKIEAFEFEGLIRGFYDNTRCPSSLYLTAGENGYVWRRV